MQKLQVANGQQLNCFLIGRFSLHFLQKICRKFLQVFSVNLISANFTEMQMPESHV
jgi:hypothetical protein